MLPDSLIEAVLAGMKRDVALQLETGHGGIGSLRVETVLWSSALPCHGTSYGVTTDRGVAELATVRLDSLRILRTDEDVLRLAIGSLKVSSTSPLILADLDDDAMDRQAVWQYMDRDVLVLEDDRL